MRAAVRGLLQENGWGVVGVISSCEAAPSDITGAWLAGRNTGVDPQSRYPDVPFTANAEGSLFWLNAVGELHVMPQSNDLRKINRRVLQRAVPDEKRYRSHTPAPQECLRNIFPVLHNGDWCKSHRFGEYRRHPGLYPGKSKLQESPAFLRGPTIVVSR